MWSSLYYSALRSTGLAAVARHRNATVILCYHNVVPDDARPGHGDPGLHCPLTRFTRQVEWLARHYRCVALDELVHGLKNGRSLRGLAAVTFDDAYAGAFRLALPLLRALDIPAAVFIVAGACDSGASFWWDQIAGRAIASAERARWLHELHGDQGAILAASPSIAGTADLEAYRPADWDTIRAAIHPGLTLGAHSLTHRCLTAISDEALRREVVEGREHIFHRTGVLPELFSYPYGLWDSRVRAAVRAAGYRAAVTLNYGLNRATADPWALRRINVPASLPDAAFAGWTAGLALRASVTGR